MRHSSHEVGNDWEEPLRQTQEARERVLNSTLNRERDTSTDDLALKLKSFMGDIHINTITHLKEMDISLSVEIILLDKDMIWNLRGLKEAQKPRLLKLVEILTKIKDVNVYQLTFKEGVCLLQDNCSSNSLNGGGQSYLTKSSTGRDYGDTKKSFQKHQVKSFSGAIEDLLLWRD